MPDEQREIALYSTGKVAHRAYRDDVDAGTVPRRCDLGHTHEQHPEAFCGASLKNVTSENEVEPGERHKICSRCAGNLRRAIEYADIYLDTHEPYIARRRAQRDQWQAEFDALVDRPGSGLAGR
jgi:hypothetical protein